MKVPVNKILPYSFVDGPGNRAAVFVQNCNLRCLYCHNPETQNLCSNCGICIEQCPAGALKKDETGKVVWDKKRCVACDTCIKVCPHKASPKIEMMDAEMAMTEIRKSLPYIRGITVSGGECTLYPDFLKDLFILAKKEGLSTLIDSNGMFDFSKRPDLLEVSDGVMLDVKSWDDEVFMKLCGAHNDTVKKNLSYLALSDKLEEVRIVCLEGYSDAYAVIDGIVETLGTERVADLLVKLIRFRKFGVKGELADHSSPDMEYMNNLKAYAENKGFGNVRIL